MLTVPVLKDPQKQGRTGHGYGIEATTCSGAGGRAYQRRRHNIWGVMAGHHNILGGRGAPRSRRGISPPPPHFYPSRKKIMNKLNQNAYGGRYAWDKGSMVMDELSTREYKRRLKREMKKHAKRFRNKKP